MGRRIHPLTGLVFDPFRRQRHNTAVRLQDFQRIPHRELTALGATGDTVGPGIHRTDEIPLPHIGMAGRLQGFFLAEIETRRIVAVAGTVEFLDDIIGQFIVIIEGITQEGIQRAAISAGDRGHIVEGLGAAFDLERVYTRFADQINERGCAKIVGIEDVTSVLALPNLHVLAGTVLLHKGVFPAAGLRALI